MNNDWIKRAKRLMSEQKVTQVDLVSAMKVKSTGAISHYFTGRNEPNISQLNALSKFLNVTPQFLIYGGEKNSEVNAELLTQCSSVVRDINEKNKLGLNEAQQVELVIFIYNQSQKEEGVEMIPESQIVATANLIMRTFAI